MKSLWDFSAGTCTRLLFHFLGYVAHTFCVLVVDHDDKESFLHDWEIYLAQFECSNRALAIHLLEISDSIPVKSLMVH